MCLWSFVIWLIARLLAKWKEDVILEYEYILRRWQNSWDQQIYSKLYEIHSLVGKTPCSYGQNRKEQVAVTKCRLGHSRLTHSYLLNSEERPECIPCNSNYSIKHVLIDCINVADVRQTFYNVNNLYDLFTYVAGDKILKFLKEMVLHYFHLWVHTTASLIVLY
jgi:hypothetical protein